MQVLKLFGLINTGIAKFAIHQLHDQKSRERIYMSWVVFRKLKFNIAEIGKLVNKNQIRVILFKGNYDKVIRSKDLDPLIKIINDLELIELDSGHNNIISSSAKFIETNPERVS